MEKLPEPPSREITPPERYLSRRELLRAAGFLGISGGLGGGLLLLSRRGRLDGAPVPTAATVDPRLVVSSEVRAPLRTDDALTPWSDVTTYNNFYELGFRKSDPARRAGSLRPRPWTVKVEGEVHRPRTFDVDELVRLFSVEERVYRMRCVEAWSMVVPWLGFPLRKLLALVEPTSRAKYVELTTLLDPAQLPGQKDDSFPWPYVEGLRLDEAMHPLTLLATGLYGKELPGQNGAPLRLVVPWKYGFKGVKSIVRIALVEQQPKTTWSTVAPTEYGFYANVNPAVAHPRWSQADERRIGEADKRATLPFNGYAEQVASLYAGMDLVRSF